MQPSNKLHADNSLACHSISQDTNAGLSRVPLVTNTLKSLDNLSAVECRCSSFGSEASCLSSHKGKVSSMATIDMCAAKLVVIKITRCCVC